MTQIHASCVALDGRGVVLRGPSGAGKSDLALRLIDDGAELVADDRVELTTEGERLYAAAPPALAGLLEARGIGILKVAHRARAQVVVVVDLVAAGETVERLPEGRTTILEGIVLPAAQLKAFEASATAKVRLAMRVAVGEATALP
jgi:serine kinase of HPr protein (carbohydrate metabolism regulator)